MAHIALVAHLDTNFGERQMITGHDSRGPQIEIYVAPATGTWTLVAMNRKGEACIIASGDNMRIVIDADRRYGEQCAGTMTVPYLEGDE